MRKLNLLFLLFLFCLPLQAMALSEPCKKKVSEKDYLFKGSDQSQTPAEKLYNFEKLRKDLKDQLINSEKLDEKKAMCLNELYKQGINDASKYWADRGQKEGCFTDNKVPRSRPEECPEATWKEFKKSRSYIQKLQEDLRRDLRPLSSAEGKSSDVVGPTCRALPLMKMPEQDMLKTAEQARVNLCCGSQNDKEGAVRAVYPEINFNQCMAKISETSEEMVSVKGLAMCSANIVSEAIKTIWDSVKSLFSLPSEIVGIMSSIKELVTNADAREQFVDNLKKSVHEFLNSRGVTFNQCLNKYEQSMYICEVTGSVIGGFVDLGAIGKVIKALRYGKAASEIGGMLSKSPKGQAVLSSLKKAEDYTLSAAGKAKAGAKAAADKVVQSLARDPKAYSVASQIMAKDVSFDLQVNGEIKKASKARAEAAKAAEAKKAEPKKSESKTAAPKDDEVIMSYTNDKGDKFELLGPEKKVAAELDEALPPKKISGSEPPAPQLEYKATAEAPAPKVEAAKVEVPAPKAEAPNYAAEKPARIERDNVAYNFEPGEKIAVPRSDGSFSPGKITEEFKDAQGKTHYRTEFDTPEGRAYKDISKEELHSQYGRFYQEQDAKFKKAEVPKVEAPKQNPNYAAEKPRIERDSTDYKFQIGEEVAVPRTGGKFSAGQIAEEFKDAKGNTHYRMEFDTPEGRAYKDISKEKLHAQYGQFYKDQEAQLQRALAPKAEVLKAEIPKAEIPKAEVPKVEAPKEVVQQAVERPAQAAPTHAPKNAIAEAQKHAEKILDTVQEPVKKIVKDELQSPSLSRTNGPDINLSSVETKLPKAVAEALPAPAPKKVDLPKAEAPRSPTPAIAEAPKSQAITKEAGNDHAANTLRDINQRSGMENRAMNEKQRLAQAFDLGITDTNRAHALDFKVGKSRKEVEGVLAKVLPDSSVDPKEIRKMLAYAPESGYVTPGEFNQAKKFVEEIEKKGGNEYLKTLNLTNSEIETVNYLIERVPHYANYADASVKPGLKTLEKKIAVPKVEAAAAPAQKPSLFEGIKVEKEAPKPDVPKEKIHQDVRSNATNRIEQLNESSNYNRRMTDRQRSQQALELGIGDENRVAAIDFKAPSTNKETEKIFAKVLPEGMRANAKELRTMLSFSPSSGYQHELIHAERFVEALEKAGGVSKLNLKGLSAEEVRVLNVYLERIPEYARYKNPEIKTSIKPVSQTP